MFGRKTPFSDPYPSRPATVAAGDAPRDGAPLPAGGEAPQTAASPSAPEPRGGGDQGALLRSDTFRHIRTAVLAAINLSAVALPTRENMERDLLSLVSDICVRDRLMVTATEQGQIVQELLNDMFGVGPIEPLLADDSVSDILVNGPDQVYVERHGRLELTPLKFRDNNHVTNVAQRIAASVGRRVDESSPMVDARLADGSRVNVVLPPLALKGTYISIRKFSKRSVTFQRMVGQGNLSQAMARVLEIACACRCNILISGGTGSGKTTLMNALSRGIDAGERIVTIEDAAELQLQQPHVVSMETRPINIEGIGAIDQRDLVRNALRMRPDRIILGETRGSEAFDVLQAMNTGHDGSMTTIHANTARDALTRLESMVLMAAGLLPMLSIRRQIASALHLIVHLERMRDGVRRVTSITEVIGIEGDVIITQDLFSFDYDASTYGEEVRGRFANTGLRPAFAKRAEYYALDRALMEAMQE